MLCDDGAEKVKLRERLPLNLNKLWDLNKSLFDISKSRRVFPQIRSNESTIAQQQLYCGSVPFPHH